MKSIKKILAGLSALTLLLALSFGSFTSNAQVGGCMFNLSDCCATSTGSTACAASGGCVGCEPQ